MTVLSLDHSSFQDWLTSSSPAVSEQTLQDVGGPRRAEDGPLHASVFEVAAVDLVGAQPLFDSLLDAVTLWEAHGAWSRGETVIHKVHSVLKQRTRRETGWKEEREKRQGDKAVRLLNLFKYCYHDFHLKQREKTKKCVIVRRGSLI